MKVLKGSYNIVLAVGFLSLPIMATAQGEEKTRDCLSMSRIDEIEVVDDSTLKFHMRGDETYVNNLPYRCSGLEHNAFIHETSMQQYCDLDTITVYDTAIGMRLGSCPLGEFELYTETEDASE